MSEQNYDELVSGAVESVLETMFFSIPLGPAEPETGAAVLEARLAFHGRPSGILGVRLSAASARILAAGFLGEDEETLTDAQPGEVVCELANMLCGSLVSRLESEESFDLSSPELVPAGSLADAGSEPLTTARQSAQAASVVRVFSESFELENGILSVTLQLEAAA
jgi:CheY-specific phosphatase CheX